MRGVNLIRALYSPQAALTGYYERLKRIRYGSGKYVLVSAMPKSGSSFLSYALCSLLGYEHSYLGFAYSNTEQELYLPKILDGYGKGSVVQQHFKANTPNLKLLKQFQIRPVVLTRNVFDVVVSVRDHLLKEGLDRIPTLIVPREYRELEYELQLDIVISLFCPWLVAFYVSWHWAAKSRGTDLLWLSYEECVQDWQGSILQVVDFYSLQKTPGEVDRALYAVTNDPRTRFNRGIIGRGDENLNARQKEEVRRMSSFFPEIPFSRIGL